LPYYKRLGLFPVGLSVIFMLRDYIAVTLMRVGIYKILETNFEISVEISEYAWRAVLNLLQSK
jgi:hypothetical protein